MPPVVFLFVKDDGGSTNAGASGGPTQTDVHVDSVNWKTRRKKNQPRPLSTLSTDDDLEVRKYSPDQPRDDHGRWTTGGGGGGSAGKQTTTHGRGNQLGGTVRPITSREARGNSRAVTAQEFQHLAAQGKAYLDEFAHGSSPPEGLTKNFDAIKQQSYAAARESWGGVTIDAHTGKPIDAKGDLYALTVRDPGMKSITVHEGASYNQFSRAMDEAVSRFGDILSRSQHSIGIFHDDHRHRIDIDPVLIVRSTHEVETIGAYTHAIGGAYHFASGNGYWPPHVGDGSGVSKAIMDETTDPEVTARRPPLSDAPTIAEFFAQERGEPSDDGVEDPEGDAAPGAAQPNPDPEFHQPINLFAK